MNKIYHIMRILVTLDPTPDWFWQRVYVLLRIFSHIITGRNEVVAKVMFLQVCVCPRGGGCLPQCMLGCHTPPQDQGDPPRPGRPPWDQGDTTPRTRQTPRDQADPLWDQADPPGTRQTPPWEADSSIWSTSGRYASYWNAFLSGDCIPCCLQIGNVALAFLSSLLVTVMLLKQILDKR